jgi:hypothetical protein
VQGWSSEIDRVLKENELLISEWAPIHLTKVLRDWFWKGNAKDVGALSVWQQTFQQLYLPQLRDEAVFRAAIEAGAESVEFFGLAQGKDGTQYIGFSFGQRTSPIMDSSLLLIDPLSPGIPTEGFSAEKIARLEDVPSKPTKGRYRSVVYRREASKLKNRTLESLARLRYALCHASSSRPGQATLPRQPTGVVGARDDDPARAFGPLGRACGRACGSGHAHGWSRTPARSRTRFSYGWRRSGGGSHFRHARADAPTRRLYDFGLGGGD